MLTHAHDRLEAHPDIEHGQTLVGNLEHMDALEDASFDTVISIDTFCSVHGYKQAMTEATRLLKPGGQMLLAEVGH